MVADAFGNGAGKISQSMSSNGNSSGYSTDGGNNNYMKDKLSGKS
jgi:hypothetical protein